MMNNMPEADWQILRSIREKALNRFCERIVKKVEPRCHWDEDECTPHQTFQELYRFIIESDKMVLNLFGNWRRSTVFMVFCGWLQAGLLTREEFEALSEDTKNRVNEMVEIKFLAD
ncbi:hypothetical protein JXO59_13790 [candidate division KSB1 bacterium]|nr:hypothetical protein [candidate division KSB1 bacterium]